MPLADLRRLFDVRRKIRPITQVTPAAHHREVDAGLAALHQHHQDVDVLVGSHFDRLLVQHARQRRHLVAQCCSLFELQLFGMCRHALFQARQHLLRLAGQQGLGVVDVLRIGLGRDVADARPGATLDLVEQTRPSAIGEHRVFAGAQAKHLLQQLDRFLHGPGTRVRPEITMPFIDRAPVVRQPRKTARHHRGLRSSSARSGDLQIRVALVVAKQDVVARLESLDQVVLEQQRLGLGAHNGRLHAHDLADHVTDARTAMALLKIVGDAFLQVAGLPHIQHRARRVEITVDARQLRQGSDFAEQLIGVRFRHKHNCGANARGTIQGEIACSGIFFAR